VVLHVSGDGERSSIRSKRGVREERTSRRPSRAAVVGVERAAQTAVAGQIPDDRCPVQTVGVHRPPVLAEPDVRDIPGVTAELLGGTSGEIPGDHDAIRPTR